MRVTFRYFLLMLIFMSGCNSEGDMSEFQKKWQDVVSSTSVTDESRVVEELVAYARSHSIIYQLSLVDAATGKPIPIADLDKLNEMPEVKLTLQADENIQLSWKPRGKDNIYKFLLE